MTTLTAGIVSIEIIGEKWDGRVFYLKAKMAADPDDVIKSIDKLRKDRERTAELEEMRRNMGTLRKNKLKQELTLAKDEEKQAAAALRRISLR